MHHELMTCWNALLALAEKEYIAYEDWESVLDPLMRAIIIAQTLDHLHSMPDHTVN